ncbi:MAG: malonyl-CoA decarboxylase [Deltaproteobacteria bacterium]|nr:malonyl-CoA decarboxylase [Deltaproteobacteria bacterium]
MPDLKPVEAIIEVFQNILQKDVDVGVLFTKAKSLYDTLDKNEKENLFQAIIVQMEVLQEDLRPILKALMHCEADDPSWPRMVSQLRNQAYSPRLEVFKKISLSPGGLKFLLDFRGELLSINRHAESDLRPLDSDIVFLFEMWFQEGFLYLEEITLNSAYRQIALIKNRDLVHPMASIEEMGQRLGKDRRCFALYHRLMPYEPIIFIEVALTRGFAHSMAEIMLDPENRPGETRTDTAVFYSINNTQNGLVGLGMGKMLIGKVVAYLKDENKKLKNFITLSPIPGFWKGFLKPILEGEDDGFSLKQNDILGYFSKKGVAKILERGGDNGVGSTDLCKVLLSILSGASWTRDEELKKDLKNPLRRIAYHYIAEEKTSRDKPLNPVAGFHLGNGATVSEKNVHFLANPAPKGLRESCGVMVNYIYSPSWLGQIRRSFRLFDRVEIRGLFGKGP